MRSWLYSQLYKIAIGGETERKRESKGWTREGFSFLKTLRRELVLVSRKPAHLRASHPHILYIISYELTATARLLLRTHQQLNTQYISPDYDDGTI